MPKKTKAHVGGRAPKLYPCHGELLTVKQAAIRLNISVYTLRNRLQLYGDNMEEVMNYYQDQEERKRVNNAVPGKDTDAMVNQLIASIMPEDVPEGCEQPEPKTITTEPAMVIVAAPDDERADLMKYNHLIAAIQDMNGVCSDNQTLDMQLNDICDALKGERCRLFEHLVDWNAIAGGK